MPNIDSPMGLRPITNAHGVIPIETWAVSATASAAAYEGCIMYRTATGEVAISNGTSAAQINHTVGVATHYVAATPGTGATVKVTSDPKQKYWIQGDDGTINTAAEKLAARGLYGVPVNPAAGNTTTLQSKMELDTSALVTTCDTNADGTILQIVDFVEAADNNYVGTTTNTANAAWVVQIPERFFLGFAGRSVL